MTMKNRGIIFLLPLLASFWPVWQWFGNNLLNDGIEIIGIIPLIPIGFYLYQRFKESPGRKPGLTLPICITLGYISGFAFLPPLVRAVIAVTAITSYLSSCFGVKFDFNLWGMSMLALPVIPTLQFFGGYPLRIMVAALSALLLRMNGLGVLQEGVMLNWCGKTIAVDAPCSGIQMLWAGMFLTFTLLLLLRTPFIKSLITLIVAFPVLIIGNALRTVTLFYTETKLLPLPSWSHQIIGISGFLFTAIALIIIVFGIEKRFLCNRKSYS